MASIRTEIYTIIRLIFLHTTPLWFQRLIEKKKEKALSLQYKGITQIPNDKEIICMIDGKVKHGGLTDRVNGIVSCFDTALKLNRKFKILFNYPFNLQDYLIPNEYDWTIENGQITYNVNSKPIFLRSLNTKQEIKRGLQLLSDLKKFHDKQLHVYSNINSTDSIRFNQLFNILFKPSNRLNNILNKERAKIGGKYVSATFRFQQLLNDFKEGDYRVLSAQNRLKLISKCVSVIEGLHTEYPNYKILVTSDSSTFLNKVSDFPFVHIVTGNIIHMEYDHNSNFLAQVKAFIDLYLIAEAEVIHSIVIKPMYKSGFPEFASKIYNRPFRIISKNIGNN